MKVGARRAHVAADADVLAVEHFDERAADRVGDVVVELRRNDAADVVTLEDRRVDVGAHANPRFRRGKWRNLWRPWWSRERSRVRHSICSRPTRPSTPTTADVGYTPEELISHARTADAMVSLLTDRIDEPVLAACPKLKVVANVAVGYDNIDVAAAARRGVVVTNTPGVLTDATADFAWALLLAVARNVVAGRPLRARRPLSRMDDDGIPRRGAGRAHARHRRIRPHRSGRRAARSGLRHARDLHQPAPRRAGGGRRNRRAFRRQGNAARVERRALAARSAHRRDAALSRRGGVRADETVGVRDQHRARSGDR